MTGICEAFREKTRNRAGLSRAAVLATVLVALAALVVAVIPGVRAYQERRARYMCAVSLERAKETALMDYLEHPGEALDEEGILAVAGQTVLCPGGGDCYLVPDDSDEGYSIICALHDTDSARRLKLNSRAALIQLRTNLRLFGPDWDLTVILNGRTVRAERAEEIPAFPPDNGIAYMTGGAGGTGGDMSEGGDGGRVPDRVSGMEISWFRMTADGLYAVWTPSDGWKEGVL